MMKTICLYSLLSLLPLAPAAAQGVQRLQSGATVSDVTISKQRDSVVIHMNIGLSDAEIARNRSVMITLCSIRIKKEHGCRPSKSWDGGSTYTTSATENHGMPNTLMP